MKVIIDSRLFAGFARYGKFFDEDVTAYYVVGSSEDKLDIADVAAMSTRKATYKIAPIKTDKTAMIATVLKDDCYWDDVVIVSADRTMDIIRVMYDSYSSQLIIASSWDEAVETIKKYRAEREERYAVLNSDKKDDIVTTDETADTAEDGTADNTSEIEQ